jgi:hypothetical protein
MLNWPFVLFSLAFGWFYALHFMFARRGWKHIRGQQTAEIDQNYVRLENYLGRSFRQKVAQWLRLPEGTESTPYLRTIRKDDESILVFGSARAPEGSSADEILVVEGEFSCGRDSRFSREIMVRGDCEVGSGSRLQAIAADGKLILGPKSRVVRWVDAAGPVDIHAGVEVRSRVFSATEILLGPDARGPAFCAPRVVSGREKTPDTAAVPPQDAIEIPGSAVRRGYDPARLVRQSEDCWIYQGDLAPQWPVHVKTKLIVRGSFSIPAGSWLEDDVKATRDLTAGELTVARGNLVAGRNLVMGRNTLFASVLYAGGTLRLREGVRGRREGGRVVAYAAGKVVAEDNVVVEGKLASGESVIAEAAQREPETGDGPAAGQAPQQRSLT